MAAKVSIIIPIYNASKEQLERSIGSAIKQTYSDIEVIAINDCSTKDETIDALTTLELEYSYTGKIRIYNNDKNAGIASTRNKGIEVASGEYVCFLDQDDYYNSEYVSSLVSMADNEHSDITMCGFTSIDENGQFKSVFPKEKCDVSSKWYPWSVCSIWNRLYNKEFLNAYNIRFPDGCVTEDIVFLMQCNIYANKVAVNTKPLYINVIGKASTSHSKSFHSLSYAQMPLKQVENIVCSNLPCKPYLYAFVCNEMTLLCNVLTIGTDTKTLTKAVHEAGRIVRLASKENSLRTIVHYNKYCKDRKAMQALILLMTFFCNVHMEQAYTCAVQKISRLIR